MTKSFTTSVIGRPVMTSRTRKFGAAAWKRNGKMRIDDTLLSFVNVIVNAYIMYPTVVQQQKHVPINTSSLDKE